MPEPKLSHLRNTSNEAGKIASNTEATQEFIQSLLWKNLEPLLAINSITLNDNGCQQLLAEKLNSLGFKCQPLSEHGVSNLIARIGDGNTRIAFSGHTDVVPPGELTAWHSPPFAPTIRNHKIFARGVADMKGGIACMLTAFSQIKAQLDLNKYSFYFLITSDEEGEAQYGTKSIVEVLKKQDELPHFCIVGEPSATNKTGDTIKVGRRGAISCQLTIGGKQGHVASPRFAQNAAHGGAKIAYQLSELTWDDGSYDFPGSSLQVTAIDTGKWTDNIIPGTTTLCFNVRYSHNYCEDKIKQRIEQHIANNTDNLNISFDWQRACTPYFNHQKSLIEKTEQAIYQTCRSFPKLSTSGGTSDGRFIASDSCQVIELGVPNNSIHQINEHVEIADLVSLETIYQKLLLNLMQ